MRWYWATRATSVAVHGELLGGPAVLGVRDVLRAKGGWVNVSRWTVSGPKGGLKGSKIG
jgi:hypothetical protein